MSDRLLDLKRLVHLANEPCSEKRRALLRDLTDVFLSEPESLTERQNWYFGEIMGQIAYDLETQVREVLAKRLAAEGQAPHELIRRLANDEISVARPVLQQSPVLTQQDLIEITESRSQDHLRAITVRPDIGADLSQALVTHGDDAVVVGLLQNQKAEIRRDTLVGIADRSRGSEPMQIAIARRRNVPNEILKDLVDWVSDKVRNEILEQFADIGKEQLDAVAASMKSEIEESPISQAERHIDHLARRGALDDASLLRFATDNRPMEFLVGFARLTDVGVETAQRVLADSSGTPLAILCRASGMGPEVFKEIAFSKMTRVPSHANAVLPLVRIYMRLNEANAQRAVRFWRTRKLTIEQMSASLEVPRAAAC